jgi:hypothetical protein
MITSDRELWCNNFKNSSYQRISDLNPGQLVASGSFPKNIYPMFAGAVQSIKRDLSSDGGVPSGAVGSGVYFKARVSYPFSTQYTDRPIMMKTVAVIAEDSAAGTKEFVDAFIEINTGSCTVGVNDEVARTNRATYTLDLSYPHDFYIFINKSSVTFLINRVGNGSVYADSIENIVFFSTKMPVQTVSVSSPVKSNVFLGRKTAVNPAASTYYALHSASWGLTSLGNDVRFSYLNTSLAYTGRADFLVPSDNNITTFNSVVPRSLYPVKTFDKFGKSYVYHWPNGFKFYMSGRSINSEDSFELQRVPASSVASLDKRNIGSSWRSLNDSEDVYVFCDSQDSGLERFSFDSILLKGCNFPNAVIVGRNSSSDEWQEIADVSMVKYSLEGLTYVDVGPVSKTARGRFSFYPGKFKSSNYYFYSEGSRALKVNTAVDSSTHLTYNGQNPTLGGKGLLFSSSLFSRLSSVYSFRYVGLKIPSFSTFEGYFRVEAFDFGLFSEIPLEYSTNIGTGASLSYGVSSYMAEDSSAIYYGSFGSKNYEFSYSITDSKTLMRTVSVLDRVTNNRSPVWVVDGRNHQHDNFSLCLVESVSGIKPLIEEDGESYYTFSIRLRSVDGE